MTEFLARIAKVPLLRAWKPTVAPPSQGMKKTQCSHCETIYSVDLDSGPGHCPTCGEPPGTANGKQNGSSATANPAIDLKSLPVGTFEPIAESRSPQASELGFYATQRDRIVLCPGCRSRLNVNLRKYGGRPAICPSCRRPFRMPQPPIESDD